MKKLKPVLVEASSNDHVAIAASLVENLRSNNFNSTATAFESAVMPAIIACSKHSNSNVLEHSKTTVPGISLASDIIYTERDIKRLRGIAEACLEANKSVASARKLIQALDNYEENL